MCGSGKKNRKEESIWVVRERNLILVSCDPDRHSDKWLNG